MTACAALVTGGMFCWGAGADEVDTNPPLVLVDAIVAGAKFDPATSAPLLLEGASPSAKSRRLTGSLSLANLEAAGVLRKAPGTGRIGVIWG